jgi:hypothetical protein
VPWKLDFSLEPVQDKLGFAYLTFPWRYELLEILREYDDENEICHVTRNWEEEDLTLTGDDVSPTPYTDDF